MRVGLIETEAPDSVFAHWRSVEAWYRDDPSLLRWRFAPTRELRSAARTSLQRDETVVSHGFTCSPQADWDYAVYTFLPGEAESGSAGVQPDEE